jgi:hypothetical protein
VPHSANPPARSRQRVTCSLGHTHQVPGSANPPDPGPSPGPRLPGPPRRLRPLPRTVRKENIPATYLAPHKRAESGCSARGQRFPHGQPTKRPTGPPSLMAFAAALSGAQRQICPPGGSIACRAHTTKIPARHQPAVSWHCLALSGILAPGRPATQRATPPANSRVPVTALNGRDIAWHCLAPSGLGRLPDGPSGQQNLANSRAHAASCTRTAPITTAQRVTRPARCSVHLPSLACSGTILHHAARERHSA